MSIKEQFIEQIEPFLIATRLSGVDIEFRMLLGVYLIFIPPPVSASWVTYFYTDTEIGFRTTIGSNTAIRGRTTDVSGIVARAISEITEQLGR